MKKLVADLSLDKQSAFDRGPCRKVWIVNWPRCWKETFWIAAKMSCCLVHGSGKTHLMSALGHELVLQDRTVYYSSCGLLVQRLLRRERPIPDDEARLVARMVELATRNTGVMATGGSRRYFMGKGGR